MNSHLCRITICLLVLFVSGSTVFAGTVFSSDFASPPLHPELQDADSAYTIDGGNISRTSSTGGGDRHYIRTVDTDYFAAVNDLLYELTFTNQNSTIQFIGLGSGTPQGNPNNEPAFGSLNFRIHSPGVAGGRVDLGFNSGVIAGY